MRIGAPCEYPHTADGWSPYRWCTQRADYAITNSTFPGMVTFYCRRHTLHALWFAADLSETFCTWPPVTPWQAPRVTP